MTRDRKLTAFCGLYCLDCIPSKSQFFSLAAQLEEMLTELKFDSYAALKSRENGVFEDYPKFLNVLKEIRRLQCTVPCRNGPCSEAGCVPDCQIRSCAINRGYEGCWQCDKCRTCELLTPMKNIHPGLEHNLEIVTKHGLEEWSDKRGKHYNWS
ncbi:MAG: DUF3795 domain-containing protein [Planctomycetota bacterium]|jgi:hypothetical protein